MLDQSASQKAALWLSGFQDALARGDASEAAGQFAETCFWRDLVAFTWNIVTLEGRADIAAMLRDALPHTQPNHWAVEGEATGADGVVESWISFETATGRGKGHLRLKDGKCWTLLTALTELKGHEERRGPTREKGAEHGAAQGRQSWAERRAKEQAELGITTQPYALVIGGGQGGIGLGARLRRLDVPTIIIDKHDRPGDAWRNRYKSLCLHDPIWYDHLPYMPFPDHWPVFSPKDKIADWLEMYTKVMELNYWTRTECRSARYDEAAGEWVVEVTRDGQPLTLRPKQLVLATGMSGIANKPDFPGMDRFKGTQHHSSQHPGGEAWAGKKCVVIGSNNSAHDICADLWENGADVTMVQRSSTHIVKSESLMEHGLAGLYSEQAVASGMTTDKADMTFASIPYRIMHEFQIPVYERIAEQRRLVLRRRWRRPGFMHDWGDDGSGLFMKYLRRGSGYYIDVGASELIADGRIKLRSGVQVTEIGENRRRSI